MCRQLVSKSYIDEPMSQCFQPDAAQESKLEYTYLTTKSRGLGSLLSGSSTVPSLSLDIELVLSDDRSSSRSESWTPSSVGLGWIGQHSGSQKLDGLRLSRHTRPLFKHKHHSDVTNSIVDRVVLSALLREPYRQPKLERRRR